MDTLVYPLGRHDHLDIDPGFMPGRIDELGLQAGTFTMIRADVPMVYLFRTRQKTTGLLRIVSISQDPKRLVVEFRLLGDEASPAAAGVTPASPWAARRYTTRHLGYSLRDEPQRVAPRTLSQDSPAPSDAIVLNWPIRWWSSHWSGAAGNTPIAALTMTSDSDSQPGHPRMIVDDPGKRKVWVKYLDMPFEVDHYPLLVMTYRARHVNGESGRYVLYLDDGSGPDYGGVVPVRQSDLIADGQVHTLTADLRDTRPIGPVIGMAIGVHAPADAHAPAEFELIDLRFESLSPQPVAQPTWPMRVQVTDEHDQPLPGATVTLHAERRNWMTARTSDEHGHATLDRAMLHGQPGKLPVAPRMLRVEADGRLPVEVRDLPADPMGNLVAVRMLPASPMRGKVIDADGRPVAGAIVRVQTDIDRAAVLGHWTRRDAEAVTDDQGRWATAPLAIVPYDAQSENRVITAQPHHRDHLVIRQTRLLPAGQSLSNGDLNLLIAEPTTLVTLDVRDEHGRPWDQAYRVVHQGQRGSVETQMRPDMVHRITTPKAGTQLLLIAPGYPPQVVTITPDDTTRPGQPVTVTLDPGRLITVTLLDDQNKPLPSAEVTLTSLSVMDMNVPQSSPGGTRHMTSWPIASSMATTWTSDAQGRIQIPAVVQPHGFVAIRVKKPGHNTGVYLNVNLGKSRATVHVPALKRQSRPRDGSRPADYDPQRIFRAVS